MFVLKVKFSVGDTVRVRWREQNYLKPGEEGQIVELSGRKRYQQALVQSFDPSCGDGRWWIFTRKLVKIDRSGKTALSVGQKVVIDNMRYIVAQIDNSLYTLVNVKTGKSLGQPLNSLYLEDLIGGYDDSNNNSGHTES